MIFTEVPGEKRGGTTEYSEYTEVRDEEGGTMNGTNFTNGEKRGNYGILGIRGRKRRGGGTTNRMKEEGGTTDAFFSL
jgi:hypothetical protein